MTVRTLSKTSLVREQAALRALLKELRHAASLRQRDLAERIGARQSFVSKFESGERRLDVVELRHICAALGVSLSEFVQRLEERIADGDV
ncbi:MAG: helix-turn-helix domain-containing protein [Thermomicrobiales bacterium]